MRKAYAEKDWELFKELLPHPDLYDNVIRVLSGQAEGPVNENFLLAVPRSFLVNEVESEKQRRFMCAQMNKPATERPKGLSASEAKEMCKSKVHEELGGEEEQQNREEQESILRAEISNMLVNIIKRLELGGEEKEVGQEIVDTVTNQLTQAKDEASAEKAEAGAELRDELAGEESMVAEMSGMAAGAVAGHAGNAWGIGEDEDGQKRRVASRN
jgi:hypothetical protein